MSRCPATSRTPSAAATVGTTRSGSVSGREIDEDHAVGIGVSHPRRPRWPGGSCPTPPGPVSVSSRTSSSCSTVLQRRALRLAANEPGQGRRQRAGRGARRCSGTACHTAGRAAARASAAFSREGEGIGQHAHGLQTRGLGEPRSRSLMPRRLSPDRSASSSWDSVAAVRNCRSRVPNAVLGSAIIARRRSRVGRSRPSVRVFRQRSRGRHVPRNPHLFASCARAVRALSGEGQGRGGCWECAGSRPRGDDRARRTVQAFVTQESERPHRCSASLVRSISGLSRRRRARRGPHGIPLRPRGRSRARGPPRAWSVVGYHQWVWRRGSEPGDQPPRLGAPRHHQHGFP